MYLSSCYSAMKHGAGFVCEHVFPVEYFQILVNCMITSQLIFIFTFFIYSGIDGPEEEEASGETVGPGGWHSVYH